MLHQNLLFVPRRVCVCVCVWIVSLLVFACPLPVKAAKTSVSQLVLGKVVSINGQRFIKIANDSVKGSRFMAMESVTSDDGGELPPDPPDRVCVSNQFDGTLMQDFTASDCACLPTPVATGYTLAGTLIDERDGKSYEVRKFADGKCWMADNLAYGGVTDECANKTTFNGYGNLSGSAWGYGDCRNNPGDPAYGYFYNWQAVVQSASSYFGYYGDDAQPFEPTQGICPDDWHVPSGSEFLALDTANGGSGAYRYGCTDVACNFFRPGYSFKGVYAGEADAYYGSLYGQGDEARWWSSTYVGYYCADAAGGCGHYLKVDSSDFYLSDWFIFSAYSVRCVSAFCEPNYLLVNASCVPVESVVPNCVASDGFQCTDCADQYGLANGTCAMIENCAVFSDGACTACEEGYAMEGEFCIPTGSVYACKIYSAPGICAECHAQCNLRYDNTCYCPAD